MVLSDEKGVLATREKTERINNKRDPEIPGNVYRVNLNNPT